MLKKATTEEMVAGVKAHAEANYEKWNVLVETYSDDAIVELIGKSRTVAGAIRKAWGTIRVHNAVEADVQGA